MKERVLVIAMCGLGPACSFIFEQYIPSDLKGTPKSELCLLVFDVTVWKPAIDDVRISAKERVYFRPGKHVVSQVRREVTTANEYVDPKSGTYMRVTITHDGVRYYEFTARAGKTYHWSRIAAKPERTWFKITGGKRTSGASVR